jgi:hypothetical protein
MQVLSIGATDDYLADAEPLILEQADGACACQIRHRASMFLFFIFTFTLWSTNHVCLVELRDIRRAR